MILCSNPSEQFKSYQSEIENAVISVMRGNSYVLGEQVKILEREFAEYIGVSSVIGVANGTDAIEIALRALNKADSDTRFPLAVLIIKAVFFIRLISSALIIGDPSGLGLQ